MKNVRRSQPCISMNFCTELSNAQSSSMWVSLMHTMGPARKIEEQIKVLNNQG